MFQSCMQVKCRKSGGLIKQSKAANVKGIVMAAGTMQNTISHNKYSNASRKEHFQVGYGKRWAMHRF